MGKAEELIEAARAGNYPMVEKILRWEISFSESLIYHISFPASSQRKRVHLPRFAEPRVELEVGTQMATPPSTTPPSTGTRRWSGCCSATRLPATRSTRPGPPLSTLPPGQDTLRYAQQQEKSDDKKWFQTVNVLLTTGPSIPNVNLTNGDKETALHCAAQVSFPPNV